MNINYLVKTLVKSTVHPFTAIVMGKKLSNDVVILCAGEKNLRRLRRMIQKIKK